MNLKINGREAEVEEGINLDGLLLKYKLKKEQVVVELNQAVPEKLSYGRTYLRDGDTVEIVKFMGGG